MGCTACDGNLHIARHAHRQYVRRHTCRIQFRQQRPHPAECFTQFRLAGIGFRHAHQPAHFEVRQLRYFAGQRNRLIRRDTVFGRLARNVHFDAHL